jgi:microcystin-dependent protein
MSDTTTPFLGLTKPAVGGSNDTWGNKDNADNDLIDANASAHDARIAALEARVTALQNSTAGEAIGTVKWWPTYLMFPAGFVRCDGTLYSITQYADLYKVLSTAFGGDGVNNFAVPDLRGMITVGMDEGTGRLQQQYGPDRLGGTGGVASTGLSVAQLPPHAHGGSTDAQGAHFHNFSAPSINPGYFVNGGPGTQITGDVARVTDSQGQHQHNITTDVQGQGAAHTNVQPGALGYWMIKATSS